MNPDTPIVDQLRDAKTTADYAAIVLQMPDTVLLDHHTRIIDVLIGRRQWETLGLVGARIAALAKVRDVHGLLSHDVAADLERQRVEVSRLAAGHTP